MPLTLVRDGEDEAAIARRLSGGWISIDGFLVDALEALGVGESMLRKAVLNHAGRDARRNPVSLPLPPGYALYGELLGGRFVADRLEMDEVIWFAAGSSGTPHLVVRSPHAGQQGPSLIGSPADLGSALPSGLPGPIVRSVFVSPCGWLYMDVDAIDSRI